MRKDVILGMSIGGVMLAVVIVYLTVSPSGKTNKHQAQVENGQVDGSGGAGDVGAGTESKETPITSAAPGAGGKKGAVAGKKEEPVKVAAKPAAEEKKDEKRPEKPADDDKPQVLAATNVEKSDPKWGDKLWGGGTPLIGVTETPDPNAGTAALLEAAGDQSAVSKRTAIVVPSTSSGPIVAPHTASPTTKPSSFAGSTGAATIGGTATAGGMRQHTVQKGETFSTIAQAAYGNANYYPFILRANPKLDPSKLRPGTVINLPDAADVKPAEEKSAEKPAGVEASPAAHRTETTVDPKKEYRVVSGDSLHKISQKLYGRADQVQKIYDLNKGAIGADPAKLKLGMVLKLPEPPTEGAK